MNTTPEPKITYEKTTGEGWVATIATGNIAIVRKDGSKWMAIEAEPQYLDLGDEQILTGWKPSKWEEWTTENTRKRAVLNALIMHWYE